MYSYFIYKKKEREQYGLCLMFDVEKLSISAKRELNADKVVWEGFLANESLAEKANTYLKELVDKMNRGKDVEKELKKPKFRFDRFEMPEGQE